MCNIRHVWSVPTHVPEYQKKGSAPISRVLFRKASHAALCHLSNLQVTLQLKRSTLHRLCRVGRAPSNDGLHELAASSRHSPNDHPSAGGLLHHLLTLTRLVPEPQVRSETVSGGHSLLPYPTVTNSFYFRKWSSLCCPDFPLAHTNVPATKPGHCLNYFAKIQIISELQA